MSKPKKDERLNRRKRIADGLCKTANSIDDLSSRFRAGKMVWKILPLTISSVLRLAGKIISPKDKK